MARAAGGDGVASAWGGSPLASRPLRPAVCAAGDKKTSLVVMSHAHSLPNLETFTSPESDCWCAGVAVLLWRCANVLLWRCVCPGALSAAVVNIVVTVLMQNSAPSNIVDDSYYVSALSPPSRTPTHTHTHTGPIHRIQIAARPA